MELTLAPFYEGWERYSELLGRAVIDLTPEQLTLQMAPTLRPVWTLAAHIIAGRVSWFHRLMGEGEPALADYLTWAADDAPLRSGAELAAGLTVSWRLIEDCLGRWTAAQLNDPFVARTGRRVTRQWIIFHVLEHDLHHGGELYYTLGSYGVPTPDLSVRALPPQPA